MHETYANMEMKMHETYANMGVKLHETYANVRFYSEKRDSSKLRMADPSPKAHVIGSSFFQRYRSHRQRYILAEDIWP